MLSKEVEKAGTVAVIRLRESKLKMGMPFMINARELPSNQAYMEYPDGGIKLVTLVKGSRQFTIIKELNATEGRVVRDRYIPIY